MGLKSSLREWIDDLLGVIYPNVCEICNTPLVRGEKLLCTQCRIDMPRTGIHTDSFTVMHQRLASTDVNICRAAGYFYYYRDNPYARLIQNAKYNGRPYIARQLGYEYASEIKDSGFFDGIDAIIPVPMHKLKLWSRGFNQSLHIAEGISKATGIAVSEALRATRRHSSQTTKGAYERWLNATESYGLAPDASLPEAGHVLIVDDVLTTGATLLACARVISEAFPSARVSVLTLGVTHLR